MRKASPADIPQLVSMMAEFYAESAYPLNHHHATAAFTTLIADDRLGDVFVLQADAKDVGYVVAALYYSMEFGGLSAFVDDLFVRQPFRHSGLGTAALTDLRELYTQRGVRAIHVETGKDNAAAQAVYQRLGFAPTDRQLLTLTLAKATHED